MSHGGGKEPDALQSVQSRELLQGMRRRTHLAAMQMRFAIIPKYLTPLVLIYINLIQTLTNMTSII